MPHLITLPDGTTAWVADGVSPTKGMELAKVAYPDAFPPPPTALGQALNAPKNIVKGVGSGLVQAVGGIGGLGHAAARYLNPEMTPFAETGFGKSITSAEQYLAPTDEGLGSQFSHGLGSFISMLGPQAGLKGLGTVIKGVAPRAAAPVAVAQTAGLGAEEARQRVETARAEGQTVTPGQEFGSLVAGVPAGLTELLPIQNLFRATKGLSKASDLTPLAYGKRALQQGAVEGVQEAGSGALQDVIAQQIYNPNQEIGGSALKEGAMGAGVGGAAQVGLDLILRKDIRKAYQASLAKKDKEELDIAMQAAKDTADADAASRPKEKIAAAQDKNPIYNPLGNFSAQKQTVADDGTTTQSAGLNADHLAFINKTRAEAGKPLLKSFSVEDLSDAGMPQQEISKLIAEKTGFTPSDTDVANAPQHIATVLNIAGQKNVDTDSQGFRDFLRRSTGTDDLNSMSPPQLFSAIKAVSALPISKTPLNLAGTSATRFSEEQYDVAIKNLNADHTEDNALSLADTIDKIKGYTGLKNDVDAESLLHTAAGRGDLYAKSYPNPDGTTNINVHVPNANKVAGGPDVRENTYASDSVPESYVIKTSQGDLEEHATEDKANSRLDTLSAVRQSLAARSTKEAAKLGDQITQSQTELDTMAAQGLTNTIEYQTKAAALANNNQAKLAKIDSLNKAAENLAEPLTIEPRGEKVTTKSDYTLYDNNEAVGTFDSREEAHAHAVSKLPDDTLRQIIAAAPNQKGDLAAELSVMAQDELKTRYGSVEGIREPHMVGNTKAEERLLSAGMFTGRFKEQAAELDRKLRPMMTRLGLGDLHLNIVNAIRASNEATADGEYSKKLIKIAIDAENPMRVLRHEGIHALKELGAFSKDQWRVLENKAKSEWISKYKILERYQGLNLSPEALIEEAIADAFSDFDQTKPPAGLIGAVFNKIKSFMEALGNSLDGIGFHTADSIFGKVEAGRLPATREPTSMGVKYSKGETHDELNKTPEGRRVVDLFAKEQAAAAKSRRDISGRGYFRGAAKRAFRPFNKALKEYTGNDEASWMRIASGLSTENRLHNEALEDLQSSKEEGKFSLRETPKGEIHDELNKTPEGRKVIDLFVKQEVAEDKANNSGSVFRYFEGAATRAFAAYAKALRAYAGDTYVDDKSNFNRIDRGLTKEFELHKEALEDLQSSKDEGKFSLREGPPLPEKQARIYASELERLVKRVGERIAGMESGKTLEDVRVAVKKLQQYTNEGIKGKEWYEDSAKAILNAFNGDKVLAEKFFQIISITSANTEVAANFTKASKAWEQFARGAEIKVGTGRENKAVSDLLNFGIDWDGRKTNTFYSNFMDAMEGKDSGRSTIDLHMTQMLFARKKPTDAQYELAENLVRLVASKRNLPARQVQAASWITQKAKSIFERYRAKGYKKALSDAELRVYAMEMAIVDYSHLLGRRTTPLPVTAKLQKPSAETRAETHVITGEVIPSVSSEMGQVAELKHKAKEDLNKIILDSGAIQGMAKALNLKSKIRISVGSGGYAGGITPNLIVHVHHDDPAIAKQDAMDLSQAMTYAFKQDAVPFFRADPALADKAQLGYRFRFKRKELTLPQERKMFKALQEELGPLAGYTKTRANELVLINYTGSDAFVKSAEEFADIAQRFQTKINEIAELEDTSVFGAESEYPYHDWTEQPAGEDLIKGLQTSEAGRSNILRRLDDVRESFKSSAREAVRSEGKEPRFSLRQTKTPEFKQWFGDSKQVNHKDFVVPDWMYRGVSDDEIIGSPKFWYHGTAKDIGTFKPKQADAIFLSLDPKFSEDWSAISALRMSQHSDELLSPEHQAELKAIRQKIYNDPKFINYRGEGLSLTDTLHKATKEFVLDKLNSGENIMPLYVRAENTFDYENPAHIEILKPIISKRYADQDKFFESKFLRELKRGAWDNIEDPDMQKVIKGAGFDSFYVEEGGHKNIAVYSPNQVKSAVGNTGAFSRKNDDVRYSIRATQTKPQGRFRQTKTPEFKQWFGKSKAVNADGTPKRYYHGTAQDISKFKPKQAGAIFLTDDPDFAESFADSSAEWMSKHSDQLLSPENEAELRAMLAKIKKNNPKDYSDKIDQAAKEFVLDKLNSGENLMPLYIRAENPFDYENPEHIKLILKKVSSPTRYIQKAELFARDLINIGNWDVIESKAIQDAIKAAGFDSFYVKEGGRKNLAVYSPNQVKSAIGNTGAFSRENDDVRYSIRSNSAQTKPQGRWDEENTDLSPDMTAAINRTTTARKNEGWSDRIAAAFSPRSFTAFRQAFIHGADSISNLTRESALQFGEQEYHADRSAIAAVLFADRAAGIAASSFVNGPPVYKNGFSSVPENSTVRGLIPILEPIMKGGAHMFQRFQFYAGTRRGSRLMYETRVGKDGKTITSTREQNFTKEDIERGKILEKMHPEFKQVFEEYQQYNNGLVQFMKDTGVISAKEAELWTKNWDYIPFYRQMDGDRINAPAIFSSISGVKKPKELKGGEAPLADFMETVIRNSRAAIEAGMKNVAGQRTIRDLLRLNQASEVPPATKGYDIVSIKQAGVTKFYKVDDSLVYEALKGLDAPHLPFVEILAKPANFLRDMVTKDPGFMLANLARDSMQAWVTSGVNMTPLFDTFKQAGKAMLGSNPEAAALARSGYFTGYDFAGDTKSSAAAVEKELRKRTGTQTGAEKALMPLSKIMDVLDKGAHISDLATRAEVYKRVLEETGSEAEATYQALEIMNFSRKGNSALIRIVTALVPFMNARIQGMDVLYRTGFGRSATVHNQKQKKLFATRSLTILGLTAMYLALAADTEEYKNATPEERDNYWILGGLGRIPIPFELGVLFKVFPERIYQHVWGMDTGADLRQSIARNLTSTLVMNPIPHVAMPIVENIANYSFFTGQPIVGKGMEDVYTPYQANPSTSLLAQLVGKETNQSPLKIDNLIRGYTGTLGTYAVMMLDAVMRGEGDDVKATKKLEQMPVFKRFMTTKQGSGTINAYYELKKEVDTAVKTVNFLERQGDYDELAVFQAGRGGKLLGIKDYLKGLDEEMSSLRTFRREARRSKMDPDNLAEIESNIKDAEINVTKNIQFVKKALD